MKQKTEILTRLLFLICLSACLPAWIFAGIPGTAGVPGDSLPEVLARQRNDFLESRLRNEAISRFPLHVLPDNPAAWTTRKKELRARIMKTAGIEVDHTLPLDMRVTGTIPMKGYEVRKIYFQTMPGVYATANLFVPEGKGPFPGVVTVLGHWRQGKIDSLGPQQLGHSMAVNGYVCLTMDPWGAGERTTVHGDYEYHGAQIGTSLLDLGKTLLGQQVVDNMRAVDLLRSLPFVDSTKIAATGASGGGNQTMWFASLDERVKAAMPVVSVGTFESAVMRSNCTCELLPFGLDFTETSGILSLFAPRALKVCNHHKDSNPTFYPQEMLRSYRNAEPVFKMMHAGEKLSYQLFDLIHGYFKEDREAFLGWMDFLMKGKGDGSPRSEGELQVRPSSDMLVFPVGQRDTLVVTTEVYCKREGEKLRKKLLQTARYDAAAKREALAHLLRAERMPAVRQQQPLPDAGGWERIVLTDEDGKPIPVLLQKPASANAPLALFVHSEGKHNIPLGDIREKLKQGHGVAVIELSGSGELLSPTDNNTRGLATFHTLSRSLLWLGKTVQGEWVKEIHSAITYLSGRFPRTAMHLVGFKEGGLAGIYYGALFPGKLREITAIDTPGSYLMDRRQGLDTFTMGIHVPGILQWGDVSLAAALTGSNITFVNPLTMSGRKLEVLIPDYRAELDRLRLACKTNGKASVK